MLQAKRGLEEPPSPKPTLSSKVPYLDRGLLRVWWIRAANLGQGLDLLTIHCGSVCLWMRTRGKPVCIHIWVSYHQVQLHLSC